MNRQLLRTTAVIDNHAPPASAGADPFRAAASALAAALLLFPLSAGCSSTTTAGGVRSVDASGVRLFLAPFFNATDDENAGRALTEITASALLQRGVPLVQTEAALSQARGDKPAGPDRTNLEPARAVGATHLLIGTVHEYRYKTDLNGNPVVGISMRLVSAKTGQTLWQGSSGHTGLFFGSLTAAAQKAVADLIARLPLTRETPKTHSPAPNP